MEPVPTDCPKGFAKIIDKCRSFDRVLRPLSGGRQDCVLVPFWTIVCNGQVKVFFFHEVGVGSRGRPGILYRIAICESKISYLRFILKSWCKSAIEVLVPQIKLLCRMTDAPADCTSTWRNRTSTPSVRGSFTPQEKIPWLDPVGGRGEVVVVRQKTSMI